MMKSKFWRDKNIVITGGTSGLGRELALALVHAGARVAVIARRQELLDDLQRIAPEIIAIQGDVSRKEQIYPLTGEINTRLGAVDFLFNNASYLGVTPLRLLVDTDCEDFEEVLQTNLLAPFRLIKALLPAMLLKQSGYVVNISSDAAVNAYPTWGTYSVSKAGLDHLTRLFQAELSKFNIQFFAVDPGDMNTPMHLAANPEADVKALRSPKDSADKLIAFLAGVSGKPERVQI